MTTKTDTQILTECATWAERRDRVVDPAVLAAVLAAHAAAGLGGPLRWKEGEARDAVVRAAADPAVLIAGTRVLGKTVDSFFRFLRNTGRLRSGSADAAALRKECARAVRQLERVLRELAHCQPDEDDEDPDEWLHPDDPQYRTRELLRDLGLRGSPGVPLPAPEVAIAQGTESGYLRLLFRLADLVADGLTRPGSSSPDAGEAGPLAEALGISDLDEVEELWQAGVIADVIRMRYDVVLGALDREAFAALPVPHQLGIVIRVARGRINRLRYDEEGSGAIALLVWSLLGHRAWVPLAEAVDVGVREDYWFDPEGRQLAAANLDWCLTILVDAGVVERDTDRARLTELGMWAVDEWVDAQFSGRWG